MKNIKSLKIVALIPPGLATAILLLFAVGETVGGDWSGLGHLVLAVPIGILMWLGWKRPLWGGILLLLMGLLVSFLFSNVLRSPEWLATFLIMVAPLLLSGLVLLGASGLERKGA